MTFSWLFPGYLVILCFFSGTRPGRTRRWIFTVYGSTCFHPRTALLGVTTISEFIGGNSPPKLPKGSYNLNRQLYIEAKRAEYMKIEISLFCCFLQSIKNDQRANFRTMLGPSNRSRGWSVVTSYQIQDGGRRPPFWKSKKRNNSAADRPIFTKFCTWT